MSKNLLKAVDVILPFTEDITKKVHGRCLAKELDLSQKTIQNHLNDLEREGILQSDNSGRTKEFGLNLESIMADKMIIMSEIVKFRDLVSSNFEVKEIVKEILETTNSYVVVYGSFAKKTWGKSSDLDVLVVGESEKALKDINEKYSREIHYMFISEKEFKKGIAKGKAYIKEIIKNHIICRGFEEITAWRFEYG